MKTISDFPSIRIEDFNSKEPRTFKTSDLDRAITLGLVTVQDVLDDTHVGACKAMKAKLKAYPDAILNIHNYFYSTPLLSSGSSDTTTLADDFKSFLKDLELLLERFSSMPFDVDTTSKVNKMETLISAVKYRYLLNLDDASVSVMLKVSDETSRLYHELFIKKVKEAIEGNRTTSQNQFVLEFGFAESFREKLHNLCDFYKSGCTLASIQEILGSQEDGILRFALDLLDASVFTGSGSAFVGSYVVSGFDSSHFDQTCKILFNIMNNHHKPTADFIKELSKKVKNENKVATIITMMQTSKQFVIEKVAGLSTYQLMWQYISNDNDRYERILFENKGCDMSRKALLTEYNKRATLYHMNKRKYKDFHLYQTKNIVSQNGMWHWVEDGENVKIFNDSRPYIESFVVEMGGRITVGEVVKFLEDEGIALKRSSVETYLNNFCRREKAGSDVFIMSDDSAMRQKGDIALEIIGFIKGQGQQVSVSDIASALSTSPSRIGRMINAHPELFVRDSVSGRRNVFITLKPGYDDKPIVLNKIKRTTSKHYNYIKMSAVDILAKAEGHSMPMKDVFDKVKVWIEGLDISDNNIYKVFKDEIFVKTPIVGGRGKLLSLDMSVYNSLYKKDASYAEEVKSDVDTQKVFNWNEDYDELKSAVVEFVKDNPNSSRFNVRDAFDSMNDIMKGTRSSLSPDSYFWLIEELLYNYLHKPTSKIEREFLRDNLAYKYEAFLDNYHYVRCGTKFDIDGLATRIQYLQNEGLLPERYSNWSSPVISDIIKKRNKVHTATRDMDAAIQKDIKSFLVLYLYTASMAE